MSSNKSYPTEDNKDNANPIVNLSLSDRSKEIMKDIAINTKTNSVRVTLNHDCKKTIVSPIYYQDWIKTANTFQK
ncbi:MAG TPA: hypothetical protein VFD60_06750, partial [Nitrososphaeraceae archaeon]|nr:hypothetical protein [Nitrososphaeraceae archaeon]